MCLSYGDEEPGRAVVDLQLAAVDILRFVAMTKEAEGRGRTGGTGGRRGSGRVEGGEAQPSTQEVTEGQRWGLGDDSL